MLSARTASTKNTLYSLGSSTSLNRCSSTDASQPDACAGDCQCNAQFRSQTAFQDVTTEANLERANTEDLGAFAVPAVLPVASKSLREPVSDIPHSYRSAFLNSTISRLRTFTSKKVDACEEQLGNRSSRVSFASQPVDAISRASKTGVKTLSRLKRKLSKGLTHSNSSLFKVKAHNTANNTTEVVKQKGTTTNNSFSSDHSTSRSSSQERQQQEENSSHNNNDEEEKKKNKTEEETQCRRNLSKKQNKIREVDILRDFYVVNDDKNVMSLEFLLQNVHINKPTWWS